MKCPVCKKVMKIQRTEIHNNLQKGKNYKEYKRVIYWCTKNDAWIGVETRIKGD